MSEPPPLPRDVERAYVYLLARWLVARQERRDVDAAGYNALTPGQVDPDALRLEAWIAPAPGTQAVLELPPDPDRRLTWRLVDQWGEVLPDPGGPGPLVLSAGAPPAREPVGEETAEGGPRHIDLISDRVKFVAEIEVLDDPAGAGALRGAVSLDVVPRLDVRPPGFVGSPVPGVEIFDVVDDVLDSAPDPAGLAEMGAAAREVAAGVTANPTARRLASEQIAERILPAFRHTAEEICRPVVWGWQRSGSAGHYERNWLARSAAALRDMWAAPIRLAARFETDWDSAGEPLAGGELYQVRFPADSLPGDQCRRRWSLALVEPGLPLSEVPLLGSHTPLVPEWDGSMRIDVGPRPVYGRPPANRLPGPRRGSFKLVMCLREPLRNVREGTWFPPQVTLG